MNKKGFTLVELLAVVVILAIILAIAVPAINNITTTAKKNMFENSSKIIIKSMKNDYDGKLSSTGTFTDTFVLYDNGVRTVYPSSNNLDFAISTTDGGIVRHSDGTITMALYDGTNCAVKTRNSNDVTVTTTDKASCVSNVIYKQAVAPFNNLITNGGFDNGKTGLSVSNNNGGINSVSIINGVCEYMTNSTHYNVFINNAMSSSSIVNNNYYLAVDVKVSTPKNFKITFSDYTGYSTAVTVSTTQTNSWTRVSSVQAATMASTGPYIYIGDLNKNIGELISFDNTISLNLTSIYGAGNEPTKAQMDINLNKVWIDTTNANTPKKFTGGGWVNY